MKTSKIIHLRKMEFYAYHGVLKEEKVLGQKFLVDIDIYLLGSAESTDDLDDTVDYSKVYAVVKECVQKERFDLIEFLADRIASRLLQEFSCMKVRVEVHKPHAPVPGIFEDISAEVIKEN